MADIDDLPYRAEYAKSGRASCRKCKGNIEKGVLRLAVLIQSPSFDGKITQWYHYMCFFTKQKPKSVQDIAHFDSLRWDDQQKIKEKIGADETGVSAVSKTCNDFKIEYAKSGRAKCKECEETLPKDLIRISKLDHESDKAKKFGPIPRWYHMQCFKSAREELEFYESGDRLPGFKTLKAEDQKELKGLLPSLQNAKKRKAEDESGVAPKKAKTKTNELMEKQNKLMFHYRDLLEKNLKKAELAELLEHNGYDPLSGESKMLDVLADLMTFGVIEKCKSCKNGNLIHKSGYGYMCSGNLSEWTKCTNTVEDPKRKPFVVPDEFKEEFSFLKKYKFKKNGNRVIIKREPSQDEIDRKPVADKSKPLKHLNFVIIGKKFSRDKKEIKEKIKSLGGEVSDQIKLTHTAAVITTPDMVGSANKKILQAKDSEIECVTEDFLDEIEPEGILQLLKKKNIAPWAKDIESRLEGYLNKKSGKKVSKYESNMPSTVKITLKDGGHIDPDTGLDDSCHVYKKFDKLYSVVLGLVDLSRGINSYYKLQILESDRGGEYYIYRRWGRIGTTVGDFKVQEKEDVTEALREFNELYEKKTGNRFIAAEQKKKPGYWYPLEIDHGEKLAENKMKLSAKESKSKLHLAVKELIELIFDVQKMESAMVEYELDLKKMPLGKLSQKQLEDAYKVLSEAMEWIKKLEAETDTKPKSKKSKKEETSLQTTKNHILDCSNRFYTLIPHDFGMKNPPLLDNEEYVKSKIEMIDNLREIEIAYNLLNAKSEDEGADDPIDVCYKKLKTGINVVDKTSDEFSMINKYVQNTHAPTHSHYTLELEEVFKIERKGEEKRFKPFKKLSNRKLLWHGSRLTNFVGILSQGLRIAPPEAPATGYMFGKGVYFADMVSKSANYCCTSKTNPTGLLLLCDVALGEMYELTNANYITKLPAGKHSTKGIGKTCPDPSETVKKEGGLEIPLGKAKTADVKKSSLLYNEYIVYDVSQVNMKYLLKTKFCYKY